MKNLFLTIIGVVVLSITSFSQSPITQLLVDNNTNCTLRIVPMVKIPNSGCSLTPYPGVSILPGTTGTVALNVSTPYELASVIVYPQGWGGTGLILYNPNFPSTISPDCENGTGSSSTITGSCENGAVLNITGTNQATVTIN